jgi:hypothetical protein
MKLPCLRRAGRDGELPTAYSRRLERPGRSRGSNYNAWLHVSTGDNRCIERVVDKFPSIGGGVVVGERLSYPQNILEKSRTKCLVATPTLAAPHTEPAG